VPLASTFMLSTKAGKEAYVEPVIENGGYRFTVKVGKPKDADGAKNGTKLSRGANFQCLMSGTPIAGGYIKAEGKAGRIGARLMAIVAEGDRGRVYLAPTPEHQEAALNATPGWKPEGAFVEDARAFTPCIYGIKEWQHLFTNRQLLALTTFSDLALEARERVQRDAIAAGLTDAKKPLNDDGTGATAYAESVGVYLAFAIDRMAMTGNNLVRWNAVGEKAQHCFGRQALPMLWDFGEPNFLGTATGSVDAAVFYSCDPLNWMGPSSPGSGKQEDAATQQTSRDKVVSTDPPYYDNVPYADLSDFFYVWLRRSLKFVFPDLFATLAVPKAEELVAFGYRHEDGKAGAEAFFLDGMTKAMRRLAKLAHPAFPVTIYYAFKQAESDVGEGIASTGWETFLNAVIHAGFATSGTWPIRTEMATRMRSMDSNALASSIILVCRPRADSAPTATRREFVAALKAELPAALAHLQRGNIAPVDLAQAAIGPGMAVYTRYADVLDAEGKLLTVRDALTLINQTLDEALAEQEGDFDADSRWALTWFEQVGFAEGEYGVAEQLSKSKITAVAGMVQAGIVASKGGRVRLLKPDELPADWDPTTDIRLTSWEIVHQLIRALESGGESAAALLVAKLGAKAEVARELCYRLYTLCERKKRAPEALSYNGLVLSWPEIMRMAQEQGKSQPEPAQANLL
jgi:putative DNA methylase